MGEEPWVSEPFRIDIGLGRQVAVTFGAVLFWGTAAARPHSIKSRPRCFNKLYLIAHKVLCRTGLFYMKNDVEGT